MKPAAEGVACAGAGEPDRRVPALACGPVAAAGDLLTGELVELAESETEGSVCLYEFTRLIHESFDDARKGRLIEELWRVAFADRVLEAREEFLIRKIARLLHLPHGDFIAARQRARSRVQEGAGQ